MSSANITFHCPGCGRELNVDARLKGRKIRCSQCKRLSLIPSSSKVRSKTVATASPKPRVGENEPAAESRSPAEPETPPPDAPPEQAAAPRKARIRIVPPARNTQQNNPPAAPAAKATAPEPSPESVPAAATPERREPEAPAASREDDPATPPVHSAASKFAVLPASPLADDVHESRKQLEKAQQELAEISAIHEREEIAYSRTIAKLSTQLQDTIRQCEAMTEELNRLRGAKQRQQAEAGQRETEYRETIEQIRNAVDAFCNAQLSGMQDLRQTIKSSVKS